ncbi:hypothetical protein [Halogeometricum luteum]|uniref:Uncharacterized protein n=1 Tax=Halogeometricum luteum TaxID=2950537 RepID=A0ABU2FXZ2_9EURY|nr:hypothetical protein [Halogeometricum sp. S3BR5-2]MDS0293399.1 hypothetical protein [Halogeometricum sp. S3BR5-2]
MSDISTATAASRRPSKSLSDIVVGYGRTLKEPSVRSLGDRVPDAR